MKKEHATLEKELDAYGACDPAKVEEKKRGVFLAHEAAVRWTGKSKLRKYMRLLADFIVMQTTSLCYSPISQGKMVQILAMFENSWNSATITRIYAD